MAVVSVAVGLFPRISTLPPRVGGSLNTGDWLLRSSVTVTPLTLPPELAAPHQTAVAVVPAVPVTSMVALLYASLSLMELAPSNDTPFALSWKLEQSMVAVPPALLTA